jgi:hypothetical protein
MGRRPWSRNEDGDDGPEKWIWILFLSGFFRQSSLLVFSLEEGDVGKPVKWDS